MAWFDTSGFMPHGHCFLWTPSLLAMHVGSDLLIGAAYLAIPFALFALLRRRPDLPFRPLFTAFSVFIALCGLTHLVAVWNIWHAEYWLEGLVKFATALASVPAAWILWRAVPAILALPSSSQLAAANRELQESNRELDAFVVTAAHDLQSPLQAARLRLDAHARGVPPETPLRHTLSTVSAELQRMSAAVDARLRLARLAREPMRRVDVDLSAAATQTLRQLATAHPGRHVRWTVEPGLATHGDASLLGILLDNVIGNAWKFTAENAEAAINVGGRVAVDAVELFVRDNGVGFDMTEATRLFEPNVRLHGAARFPGHGIGLASVRRIVERHGGTVRITSSPGVGTIVTVTLPAPVGAAFDVRATAVA